MGAAWVQEMRTIKYLATATDVLNLVIEENIYMVLLFTHIKDL